MTLAKYKLVILLGTVSLLLPFLSLPALAQNTGFTSDGTYTLLEPLPGFGEGSKVLSRTNLLGRYLENAYTLVLQAAAIICVISIMVGGIQYITAAAADTKSAARSRIWNNLIGFLIVLAAYLILYTINPNLVNFKLEIPKIPGMGGFAGPGTFLIYDEKTGVYRPSSQIAGPQSQIPSNYTLGDEFVNRTILEQNGFTIFESSPGATEVKGLRPETINGIITLKNDCGCPMTITGGSESGNGHSAPSSGNNYMAHSNGYKVDIDDTAAVRNYVTSTFDRKRDGSGRAITFSDGPVYEGTIQYADQNVTVQIIDEGNHFDFLFKGQ
jgi:hypothetical protein